MDWCLKKSLSMILAWLPLVSFSLLSFFSPFYDSEWHREETNQRPKMLQKLFCSLFLRELTLLILLLSLSLERSEGRECICLDSRKWEVIKPLQKQLSFNWRSKSSDSGEERKGKRVSSVWPVGWEQHCSEGDTIFIQKEKRESRKQSTETERNSLNLSFFVWAKRMKRVLGLETTTTAKSIVITLDDLNVKYY